MTPIARWNDDRLDELNRRLISVESTVQTVGVINEKVATLERSQREQSKKLTGIDEKLDKVVDEPLIRARDFRRQVAQGVIAATVGGALVLLITILAGVH